MLVPNLKLFSKIEQPRCFEKRAEKFSIIYPLPTNDIKYTRGAHLRYFLLAQRGERCKRKHLPSNLSLPPLLSPYTRHIKPILYVFSTLKDNDLCRSIVLLTKNVTLHFSPSLLSVLPWINRSFFFVLIFFFIFFSFFFLLSFRQKKNPIDRRAAISARDMVLTIKTCVITVSSALPDFFFFFFILIS